MKEFLKTVNIGEVTGKMVDCVICPIRHALKDVVFLNYLLSMTMFLNTDISQGSVMTQNDQLYASNMNNTGHKASSHLICTQLAFTMSAMISGAMSVMEVFFG